MKKIEQFTNKYPLTKTLRFSLIPVGKTEENFNNKLLLESDEKRADAYIKVKSYIDRYHRHYIESVLSKLTVDNIDSYADLYYKVNKTDSDIKEMEKLETKMRKDVANALTSTDIYKQKLFKRELVKEILPNFLTEKEELESVEMFQDFFTYFTGFNENRENMYSPEPQTTAISYRCINDNLPKFLDNAKNFEKIKNEIPDKIEKLNSDCEGLYGVLASDVFSVDYFSFVLSQSGIDKYNGIIGGYTNSDGTKVQGLNEYINLYNQQVAKTDKSKRLPLVKSLYKQILTESNTVSFIPEKFKNDDEVITAINDFYINICKPSLVDNNGIKDVFTVFANYSLDGIFVKSTAITEISKAVLGNWSAIATAWQQEYCTNNPLKKGKDEEKYLETVKNEYNKIKSFSITEIARLGSLYNDENVDIGEFYSNLVLEKISTIISAYDKAKDLLTSKYTDNKKLCKNDKAIELIKNLLDSIKDLEHTLKNLLGTGKEENKDDAFYGKFLPLYENIAELDRIYDKVRNYVTQKPYSKDKIKLNFENPQLLGGWDKNKERDYRTVLLMQDNKYYLAIMDKSNNKAFLNPPYSDGEDAFSKIEYKLLPGPNKMLPKVFFASSNIDYYAPSKEILDIYKKGSFKKGKDFNIDDCHKFINFFKDSINKHADWSQYGFNFASTDKYRDIGEFYNEVREQGYAIKYKNISKSYINNLVETGQLYLFQIYNKDFSEHSKGKKNLHTLYFEMLFDERNLADVVYQLNGGAEMFYRKASIKDSEKIVHPANQPIENKNDLNPKKESLFEYDIIKDKRFTERQFSLHIPITLNFKAEGQTYLNNDVRLALKNSDDTHIIGIDRGERNLLYISVINSKGEMVEQKSLNLIGNVDYHNLLDKKEEKRNKARKSWGTIENIKELKEGYLSQVVHEICRLVVKYDAIIAMEDLNFGFKTGRFKVEKQVYQKFENMLIYKLNYLVDKNITDPTQKGGLLNAYQLTNKVDGVNRAKQNGIIFYVPAWNTSKIDPKTGFVNLFNTKYTSVTDAKTFVSTIDDIRYNSAENLFEFDVDYSKFPKGSLSYKKQWTVCSNGERIIAFRNADKNSEWDNKRIILTDEFKNLFEEYNVDYNANLKDGILAQTEKKFFERFLKLFSYVLQMRNSIIGDKEDYLISPVKDANGNFFDSRKSDQTLPQDADANGAFNIARKALWAVNVLKNTDDENIKDAKLSVKNAEWLEFAQK